MRFVPWHPTDAVFLRKLFLTESLNAEKLIYSTTPTAIAHIDDVY
jgi:hypothetical protein